MVKKIIAAKNESNKPVVSEENTSADNDQRKFNWCQKEGVIT